MNKDIWTVIDCCLCSQYHNQDDENTPQEPPSDEKRISDFIFVQHLEPSNYCPVLLSNFLHFAYFFQIVIQSSAPIKSDESVTFPSSSFPVFIFKWSVSFWRCNRVSFLLKSTFCSGVWVTVQNDRILFASCLERILSRRRLSRYSSDVETFTDRSRVVRWGDRSGDKDLTETKRYD